ncbi:unnamed protein product [Arabidopsis halleri]
MSCREDREREEDDQFRHRSKPMISARTSSFISDQIRKIDRRFVMDLHTHLCQHLQSIIENDFKTGLHKFHRSW